MGANAERNETMELTIQSGAPELPSSDAVFKQMVELEVSPVFGLWNAEVGVSDTESSDTEPKESRARAPTPSLVVSAVQTFLSGRIRETSHSQSVQG